MLDIVLRNMCQESIVSKPLNHVENIPSSTDGLPIIFAWIHKLGNTNTNFLVYQGTPKPQIK